MSDSPLGTNIDMWLAEPMPDSVTKSIERLARADDVQHVAVMPDVHLAGHICIGTVVATSHLLYPDAVGGDIGCGMAAVRLETTNDLLRCERSAARLLEGLYQRVPSNRHSRSSMPARLPNRLLAQPLSHPKLDKLKSRDGRVQFGTLGRGNHFLEFQADQASRLWMMVHSGSRAMGQAIARHHLCNTSRTSSSFGCLDAHSDTGRAYLQDVEWALQYAEHNRLAMVEAVARLMHDLFGVGTTWTTLVHGHHNHIRRELHFGKELWVHRKGAQSARVDEPGIIPGSMGTRSFLVVGRGCRASLCSSSHGAGRKMSRTVARKTTTTRQLFRQMNDVWFDHRKANALRDEAPAAYRDIRAVMRAQKDLTQITNELRPVLSYKGI